MSVHGSLIWGPPRGSVYKSKYHKSLYTGAGSAAGWWIADNYTKAVLLRLLPQVVPMGAEHKGIRNQRGHEKVPL